MTSRLGFPLICPPSMTVDTDPGVCYATVNLQSPGVGVNLCASGTPAIVCNRSDNANLNDPFPLGVTTIGCTATLDGETVSCQYTITVEDNEAPVCATPLDVVVQANNTSGTNVNLPPIVAFDNCMFTTGSSHSDGFFPCGTTVVTYTADDGVNPVASCSFNVIVQCINVTPCPDCPNNIVLNGGIFDGASAGDLGVTGSSNSWSVSIGTPQVVDVDFCADPFCMQMWGNQDIGEAIEQPVNFVAGETYSISFCARFQNNDSTLTTPVQFGFSASNGAIDPFINQPNIGTTNQISDPNWNCYTLDDWTPTQNFNTLTINVFNVNPNVSGDPTTVSWGRIDNICIEKVEQDTCCKDFDAFCDRVEDGFTWSIVDPDSCKLLIKPTNFNECMEITEWEWGDGSNGGQPNADGSYCHYYSQGGTYTICFLAIELDENGDTCWQKEYCEEITIDCNSTTDPCDSLDFAWSYDNSQQFGECCWNVDLHQQYLDNAVKAVLIDNVQGANISIHLNGGWMVGSVFSQYDITPPGGGFIQQGAYNDQFTVCFENITVSSQQLDLYWLITDPANPDSCIWVCPKTIFSDCDINNSFESYYDNRVILYPNPTAGDLTLAFSEPVTSNLKLHLVDLVGRKVEVQHLQRGITKHHLNVATLPPAVYFIKLTDEAGRTWQSKFVKQ